MNMFSTKDLASPGPVFHGDMESVDRIEKTVCPRNCFDTCGLLAYIKDEKLVGITGDPEHPITKGHLCAKATTYVRRTYHKDRIKYPLMRVGKRGEADFKRVSWDDAFEYITNKLAFCKKKYGTQSVTEYCYSGNREFLGKAISGRFLNLIGASRLVGSFCLLSGLSGATYTNGTQYVQGIEIWSKKAEVIMIVGHNSSFTNVHSLPFIWDAIERGAYLIVIDPYLTPIAAKADLFLQPRPGTDTAMVLAMMNHIFNKGLEDKDFISKHTYGIEELKNGVRDWSLEKAAEVTGIDPHKIEKAAELYAKNLSHMECGWGHQRYTNGHQAQRAYSCLAAICGHIGKEGATCNYLDMNAYNTIRPEHIASPLYTRGFLDSEKVVYPRGAPHRTLQKRLINISTFGPALREAENPPLKAVLSWRGGIISQLPNANKMTETLKGLELLVSSEIFMTDDTDWADIVLPAADTFEQWGIHPSYWHHYVQIQRPVIPPLYESKTDIDIWAELGRRMGHERFFPKTHTGLEWIKELLPDDFELTDSMDSEMIVEVPEKYAPKVPWSDHVFNTPTGKIELYSTGMVDRGRRYPGEWNPIPHFEEPGESPISRPDLFKKYPLMMISQHAPLRTHCQWFNIEEIQEIEGPPGIFINEMDAREYMISEGDVVKVFNGRGEISVIAKVTNRIKKGVVEINSGNWVKSGSSANVLMDDTIGGPRDVGAGVMIAYDFERDGNTIAYFNCLVQIEKQ